ncbi:MAG: D-erythronate dehydrogenase [Saprospiraceae bacterium]|nr:D-erythronate dehydrogenase [Saprospiraceae bacterium]
MQIIITGGAGFLGQKLAKALLKNPIEFDELLLVDVIMPGVPHQDERIVCKQVDLSDPGVAETLIRTDTGLIFHLAAILSSHAEKDFDLGWKINLDITKQLLEACRQRKPGIRFIFASSLAVYGGSLPKEVNDTTALTPRSSYGIQKAMGELLVNDYTRKNFVDGRVLRLPTISVRPGKPNLAASSFVSSIIREPLHGEQTICPVDPGLGLWLSSPDTTIANFIHAAQLDPAQLGQWRSINLPGLGVTVREMLNALEKVAGNSAVGLIQFKTDPAINNIVGGWPGQIDNTPALKLGFKADLHFEDVIHQFIESDRSQV